MQGIGAAEQFQDQVLHGKDSDTGDQKKDAGGVAGQGHGQGYCSHKTG